MAKSSKHPHPREYARAMIDGWGREKAYQMSIDAYQRSKPRSPRYYWWAQVMSVLAPPPEPVRAIPDVERACRLLSQQGIKYARNGNILVF